MTEKEWDLFWATAIAGFVGLELYLRSRNDNSTLSCAKRRWFRTHTRAGQVTFAVGYGAFSSWYLPHIIRQLKRLDVGETLST